MQTNLTRKFKTLALICLLTSFAGIIYQLVHEERLDHNSVLFGLPLGFVFGMLELFLFPKAEKRFRRWPFSKMLLFKAPGSIGSRLVMLSRYLHFKIIWGMIECIETKAL
jgi:hypothetical protein